jgi:hypothetical protein
LDDLVQYDSPERRAKENIMFRRIPAAVAAFVLTLSFASFAVTSTAHAADVGAPATNLASAEVASQVTDTLTLFIKRAGSSKPESRHRAWEMLSPTAQENLFFGNEEQGFYVVKGKIVQIGAVTVEDGGIGVEVFVSGLWTTHGFYHNKFLLVPNGDSYLIGDSVNLDLVVPEGMTGTTIQVDMREGAITIDQTEIADTDIVLISITNDGADLQLVELDRMYDGETVDALAGHMADRSQDQYAFTGVQPGDTAIIGLARIEPGTYVISTIITGTASTPQTIIASAVITITK